jgi:hypothetical protein
LVHRRDACYGAGDLNRCILALNDHETIFVTALPVKQIVYFVAEWVSNPETIRPIEGDARQGAAGVGFIEVPADLALKCVHPYGRSGTLIDRKRPEHEPSRILSTSLNRFLRSGTDVDMTNSTSWVVVMGLRMSRLRQCAPTGIKRLNGCFILKGVASWQRQPAGEMYARLFCQSTEFAMTGDSSSD